MKPKTKTETKANATKTKWTLRQETRCNKIERLLEKVDQKIGKMIKERDELASKYDDLCAQFAVYFRSTE